MKADKEKIKEQKMIAATIKFYNFLNENGGFYTKKELINLGFEESKINQILKLNFSSVLPELSENLYHKSQFDGEKLIKNYMYIYKLINKKYSNLSNVILIQFFVYLKSLDKKLFKKEDLDKIAFEQLSFEMGR